MEKFEGQMPKRDVEKLLHDTAQEWAKEFDPMSLVVLNSAIGEFDVSDKLDRIRAMFFYVLCDTDEFYPASIGEQVAKQMRDAGACVTFHPVSRRVPCPHDGRSELGITCIYCP